MATAGTSRPATKWCHLKDGTAGPVDQDLSQFLASIQDQASPIGIDLSQVTFIEPASMLIILAIDSTRRLKNHPTTIQFPSALSARTVLATWRFLDALKILGHPAVPVASPVKSGPLGPRDNLEEEIQRTYLPIKIICGLTEEDKPGNEHVDAELQRANEPTIVAWLQSHLQCRPDIDHTERRNFVKDTFPSRIVFEAMMNSVRHPQATRIVTTSHIQWSPSQHDRGYFTSVWWDDGKGIVETLTRAMSAGNSIMSSAPPLPEKRCSIKFAAADDGSPSYSTLTTNYVPRMDSSDAEVLFSSMCSRITRDPAGIGHRTNLSEDVPKDSPLRQPGMGLYILVDCAVSIFGGAVAFRTGNLFMNVKRGPQRGPRKADYAVSISSPSTRFRFPGNMLIVRLPILRQSR